MDDIASISGRFAIPGRLRSVAPHGNGHINDTFLAEYEQEGRPVRYVHQRINRQVFADPHAVMDNIGRVTAHLHRKLAAAGVEDPQRRALTVVRTTAGESLVQANDGSCWRTYRFIEGTRTQQTIDFPQQAYQAARAFGCFQAGLADLPPPALIETIPAFHDTPRRLRALERAVAEARTDRRQAARPQIDLAREQARLADTLVALHATGAIPARVTHNDTKLNNVLFDAASGEAICVVDLDTVMPGLSLYDFGDMVRTMTCPAAEDEADLTRIDVDPVLFEAIVRGYLETAGDMLNPTERAHLLAAGLTIVFEQGVRFLTDYLSGDVYYKIEHPEHNLQRCRAQFALLTALLRREAQLEAVVGNTARRADRKA